jgi:DNA replication and repair protein RecF
MLLSTIEVTNFRNLTGKLVWGPHLNIIFGRNGQGKTNWLEAIYVLARTKSFRTQRLQEAIKFNESLAVVQGTVTSGQEIVRDLQVTLQNNTKTIQVNGKREALTRYLTQLQVFSFTAADLEIVRGMPDARRRFLDRSIASIKPAYIQTVTDYGRVLKQKNKLLQIASESQYRVEHLADLLGPWNDQLVQLGAEVHRERSKYVERLNQTLERQLFDRKEIITRYLSSVARDESAGSYEEGLRERLKLRMPAEMASGHALIGPHRDDLEIHLDGREIKVFGSSGQQRSALLLLDLAAISLYNLDSNDAPVFVIDDVDAELDEGRIRHLLEYLENRTQTFITTSKRTHVEGFLSRAEVFEIEQGMVRESCATDTLFVGN